MTTLATALSVTYRLISDLRAYERNARTHSKKQLKQIADSIQTFGFTNPVLIDSSGTIIAGHGRVEAAKLLQLETVPTILLESMTKAQIRAYVIADNKLAEAAGWDKSILKIEFESFVADNLDLALTGFEIAEIDLILQTDVGDANPEEFAPEILPPVSSVGDLWLLGEHRILCGSSLLDSSLEELMGRRKADVVFTDPPYNVRIPGHVCGNGSVKHEDFAMASGEMSKSEFTDFLAKAMIQLERHSKSGAVHFICQDWRHIQEITEAGQRVYDSLLNMCVWVKNNGGMGSFYRSQHELIFVFRKGKSHRNNIQLGKFGRTRTNVWEYPGVNTFSKQGDEGNLLALHPTVKPTALVADALLDCSAPNDIVLDSFLGSGTTLMAAEQTGRVCYGIELDPRYVDTAIRRWEKRTGLNAIHASSTRTFNAVSNEKENPNE
jgi:DNA modification methylase